MALEGVKLTFAKQALQAVAKAAIKRKSGARGLRAILETVMLDLMYDIPSKKTAREVVISEEAVLRRKDPVVLYTPDEATPPPPSPSPKKETAA